MLCDPLLRKEMSPGLIGTMGVGAGTQENHAGEGGPRVGAETKKCS